MTDPTNVHEPVPQSAKLTAREKKWIIYDVGNSAFVLLSTAVIPIYAKSLMPADGNIVSAWGYAQTIASLVIALLMPLSPSTSPGAWMDSSCTRSSEEVRISLTRPCSSKYMR